MRYIHEQAYYRDRDRDADVHSDPRAHGHARAQSDGPNTAASSSPISITYPIAGLDRLPARRLRAPQRISFA